MKTQTSKNKNEKPKKSTKKNECEENRERKTDKKSFLW